MEVENGPIVKEMSLGGTHSPLPWLWEEEYWFLLRLSIYMVKLNVDSDNDKWSILLL